MFRQSLAHDITVVLVAKLVLLLLGFWLFFSPGTRASLTPNSVLDHLAPAASAPDAGVVSSRGADD